MYDDDDDDESNDSDYGSKDAESRVEEGAMDVMAEERKIVPISTKRQKIADDIFNEMNKKQNEFIKTKMSQALLFDPYHFSIEKSINKNEEKREVINKSNKNQKYSQMQSMLSSVFGNKSTEINVKKIIDSSASQASIRDEIRRAVAGLHHKQIVTESVKFAGKEIKVKVSKDVVGSGSSSNTTKPSAKRGIDDVLDTMKGPRMISTVDKSSMDWTNFKEQEGLEDTLAVAAKEGYLTRQEFLTRCDVRAFEQERDVRLTKQAAASSSSSAGPPGL